jgi:Fur family peroxide stress response transcriptional regulator
VRVPKAEVDRRMKQFVEQCRRSGMRVTHQRTEVFRELAGTGEHPDAETLYQRVRRRVPAISRDTVYRALAALEARGLVRKAEILFNRARYDANMDRHHHFVCTVCGRVSDFYSQALDDLPIPRSVASLGRVQSTHVQVRGVCSACVGRKGKA